jgi:ribosomal protein S18 acetylase RimI-like enzyme
VRGGWKVKILHAILLKAKEKGGIWFLAKKVFSLERWVLMERDMEIPIPPLRIEGCYQVRTAKVEDLYLFAHLHKKVYADVEGFAKRLKSGQTCYIALDKGKIIYFVWVSSYDIPKSLTSRFVKLKPQEVYMYHALCLPEYRRKKIHSSVMTIRLKDLQEKSFKKAYVDCQVNNVPQVKTLLKHGFIPYKITLVLTLLGKAFCFSVKQSDLLKKIANS